MIITEENRRRASVIEEEGEDGETVSLLGPASINHFLVKKNLPFFEKKIFMNFFLQEYPVHLLPPSFFQITLPGQSAHDESEDSTQSSIVTM